MAQKETPTDKTQKSSLPNFIPPEFTAMGKKRLEELVGMQAERVETLQEINRNWFDRMQLEATLASEFATKLTEARSIPETATACQEWATKRTEMAAEDARRILANGQKLAETGKKETPSKKKETPEWLKKFLRNGTKSVKEENIDELSANINDTRFEQPGMAKRVGEVSYELLPLARPTRKTPDGHGGST